jgi:lysozyme family protein
MVGFTRITVGEANINTVRNVRETKIRTARVRAGRGVTVEISLLHLSTASSAPFGQFIQCGKSATTSTTVVSAVRVPWSSPTAWVQGCAEDRVLRTHLRSLRMHLSAENTLHV